MFGVWVRQGFSEDISTTKIWKNSFAAVHSQHLDVTHSNKSEPSKTQPEIFKNDAWCSPHRRRFFCLTLTQKGCTDPPFAGNLRYPRHLSISCTLKHLPYFHKSSRHTAMMPSGGLHPVGGVATPKRWAARNGGWTFNFNFDVKFVNLRLWCWLLPLGIFLFICNLQICFKKTPETFEKKVPRQTSKRTTVCFASNFWASKILSVTLSSWISAVKTRNKWM